MNHSVKTYQYPPSRKNCRAVSNRAKRTPGEEEGGGEQGAPSMWNYSAPANDQPGFPAIATTRHAHVC